MKASGLGFLILLATTGCGVAAEEPLPCNALCRMWMGTAAPPEPGDTRGEPGPALVLQGAVAPTALPPPAPPEARPAPVSRLAEAPTVATRREAVPLPPRRPAGPSDAPVRVASAARVEPSVPLAEQPPAPARSPDPVMALPQPSVVAAETASASSVPNGQPAPPGEATVEVAVVLPPPAPVADASEELDRPVAMTPDRTPPRQTVWPPSLDVIASVLLSAPAR